MMIRNLLSISFTLFWMTVTMGCEGWDAADESFEDQVLALTNQRRAAGADCGSEGVFAGTRALSHNDLLREAARAHTLDMLENGFFSHTSSDGSQLDTRVDRVGYLWGGIGENIAMGQTTPEEVVEGWMQSDGHCANIMNDSFMQLGVGYRAPFWTQVFGTPGR